MEAARGEVATYPVVVEKPKKPAAAAAAAAAGGGGASQVSSPAAQAQPAAAASGAAMGAVSDAMVVHAAASASTLTTTGEAAPAAEPRRTTMHRTRCIHELGQACIHFVGCQDKDGVTVEAILAFARMHAAADLDQAAIQHLWEALCASTDVKFYQRGKPATKVSASVDGNEGIRAVPSARLADSVIGVTDPNLALNEQQRRIMQMVAQAGVQGTMQADIARHIGTNAKAVFYQMRTLQGYGLVRLTRQSNTVGVVLTRHHQAYAARAEEVMAQTQAGSVAEWQSIAVKAVELLRAALNTTMVETEVRAKVNCRGNVHKTRWAGIMRKLLKMGVSNVKVTVNGKFVKCLQLEAPNSAVAAGIGSAAELELMAEETLKHQLYEMIRGSGGSGVTHSDMAIRLGLPPGDKLSYLLCCNMVQRDGWVRSIAESIKGRYQYKLVAVENYSTEVDGKQLEQVGVGQGPTGRTAVYSQLNLHRKEKTVAIVQKEKIIWAHDLPYRLNECDGTGVLMDGKAIRRMLADLEDVQKLKTITLAIPLQRVDSTQDRLAICSMDVDLKSAVVAEFVSRSGEVKVKQFEMKRLQEVNVAVEHDRTGLHDKSTGIAVRALRLGYGFLEMKVARARAAHKYLWGQECFANGTPFTLSSLLKDLPICTFAQLMGIQDRVPGIDELFERNQPMSQVRTKTL